MALQKRRSALRKNLSEHGPWEDDVLREVYAVRDAYAADHGYDLGKIYTDLKRREAANRLRRANAQVEAWRQTEVSERTPERPTLEDRPRRIE